VRRARIGKLAASFSIYVKGCLGEPAFFQQGRFGEPTLRHGGSKIRIQRSRRLQCLEKRRFCAWTSAFYALNVAKCGHLLDTTLELSTKWRAFAPFVRALLALMRQSHERNRTKVRIE